MATAASAVRAAPAQHVQPGLHGQGLGGRGSGMGKEHRAQAGGEGGMRPGRRNAVRRACGLRDCGTGVAVSGQGYRTSCHPSSRRRGRGWGRAGERAFPGPAKGVSIWNGACFVRRRRVPGLEMHDIFESGSKIVADRRQKGASCRHSTNSWPRWPGPGDRTPRTPPTWTCSSTAPARSSWRSRNAWTPWSRPPRPPATPCACTSPWAARPWTPTTPLHLETDPDKLARHHRLHRVRGLLPQGLRGAFRGHGPVPGRAARRGPSPAQPGGRRGSPGTLHGPSP